MPGFMTLDRMDASSRAGAQLGWNKIDDVGVGDAFDMRLEPFGQYILPNRAVGLYGHVPLAHRFDLRLAAEMDESEQSRGAKRASLLAAAFRASGRLRT